MKTLPTNTLRLHRPLKKKYFQKNSIFLFLEGTYPKSRQKTTTTTQF
jgi:hypothetical protein